MITGFLRLFQRRLTRSLQRRQQYCRLHLSAGYRHAVVNATQTAAGNLQRRQAIVRFAADFRAHQTQRIDDALHRALAQRRIAV